MQDKLRADVPVFVRSRSHTPTYCNAFIPIVDHRQGAPISMHVRTCVESTSVESSRRRVDGVEVDVISTQLPTTRAVDGRVDATAAQSHDVRRIDNGRIATTVVLETHDGTRGDAQRPTRRPPYF